MHHNKFCLEHINSYIFYNIRYELFEKDGLIAFVLCGIINMTKSLYLNLKSILLIIYLISKYSLISFKYVFFTILVISSKDELG